MSERRSRKDSNVYLGTGSSPHTVSLTGVGAGIRITWLDGQEATFGGRSETLVGTRPVWSGGKVAPCR